MVIGSKGLVTPEVRLQRWEMSSRRQGFMLERCYLQVLYTFFKCGNVLTFRPLVCVGHWPCHGAWLPLPGSLEGTVGT